MQVTVVWVVYCHKFMKEEKRFVCYDSRLLSKEECAGLRDSFHIGFDNQRCTGSTHRAKGNIVRVEGRYLST